MTAQVAVLISFVIYLAFFGWLGWRRGFTREIVVLSTALVSWVLLQARGEVLVSFANLGGAAFTLVRSGGLTGDRAEAFAAISEAPSTITADTEGPFLFVVWVALFILTYVLTNTLIPDAASERNGWASLFGMINGLFFAVAFLPSLGAIFAPEGVLPDLGTIFSPEGVLPDAGIRVGLLSILGGGLQLIWEGITAIWNMIEPLGSWALLVLLTLLLVFTASTIRGRGGSASANS